MAWDTSEPQDTTKIRNLGVVIRPNWVAIEEAGSTFKPHALNLTDRTVAGVSNDPTAIADAYIVYSKTDAAGNPEFFGIDDSSNVLQLSYGGNLGSPTTDLTVQNINFSTSSTNYTRNNIVTAFGSFLSNGTTVVANNCSISRTATGTYQVTLNPVATSTNYVVTATLVGTTSRRFPNVTINSVSLFTVTIADLNASAIDTACMFQVCGGF